MRIEIDIPKEFEEHFNQDRFEDSLNRLLADTHLLAGHYERELVIMLIKAFNESKKPSIDWSKISVDTPILVRDYERDGWERRYFAKYVDGTVYAWDSGATSWSAINSRSITSWKYAKLAETDGAK